MRRFGLAAVALTSIATGAFGNGALGARAATPPPPPYTEPTCSGTTVVPPCVFQGFEIDGNTSVDTTTTPTPLDWKSPPPNLTHFSDATGPTDDIFSSGSKELDQTTWTCTNSSAPPKSDIYPGGDISFRNFTTASGAVHQVVDVDFSRVGTGGDAHIDYEFNKGSAGTLTTGGCSSAGIPVRSVGDILLAFDSDTGGSNVTVSAYRWNGSTFIALGTGSQGVTFEGTENGIPSTVFSDTGVSPGQFGEAGLDLTATIGSFQCHQFGTAYMKSRSSTSITSEVKDRTEVLPFNPGSCPSSSLAKSVRDVTTGGAYGTSIAANPGDTVQYQLEYKNTGSAAASNVVVTDAIPAHSTYLAGSCSNSCIAASAATFNAASPCSSTPAAAGATVTELVWCLGSEPAGADVFITFETTLDSTFPQGTTQIDNVATFSTTEEGSHSSNHTTVNVTANPSLAISKTADSASANAGDTIGFTIKVTNTGSAAATNVVVTDNLPTSPPGLSWSVSPAVTGCGIAGTPPVLTCNVGTLAAHTGSFSVHISSKTGATTCGTVSNSANVMATGVTTLTSSPLTTIVVNCAHIGITKTADAATVNAGSDVGYKITVSNTGAGFATNVQVSDTLPTLSGISWFLSPANTPSGCSISSATPQVLSCTFPTVTSGSQIVIHVVSHTTAATCGQLTNSASLTSDNAGSASTGSVSITVTCPNLAITKTADSGTVSAGQQVGFLITVSNTGNGAATNVTVSDTLPNAAGLNWQLSPANTPATCSISSMASPPQVLSCTFASLAPGTVTIHVISTTTAASCSTLSNSATVTASNNNPFSLTSSPLATVTVQCPDVHITKTADQSTVNAGGTIGFTVTVTNKGAGTASNVTVSDNLPTNAGLNWSIKSVTPALTPPDACSISPTTGSPQVLTCNIASLAPNASVAVDVTSATTAASCGTVTNTASVSLSNGGSDQTLPVSLTVTCAVLHVTKTVCPQGSVAPGGLLTYTIAYSNTGNGDATTATISDVIPTGTSLANAGGGTLSPDGTTVTWQVGPLAPGAGSSKTLVVLVTAGNGATISNTANFSSPQAAVTATSTVTNLVSNASAITHGSAYGLNVAALGLSLPLLTHVAPVSTVAPPNSGPAVNNLLTVPTVAGVPVSISVLDQTSQSSVTDQATSTATSTATTVNLLNGAITATSVEGVSQSVANTTSASFNSTGSNFVNLVVNGKTLTNVTPNTHVTVYFPGTHTQLADAVLYEQSGTSGLSSGLWSASHQVNMIHVTLTSPLGILPAGAEIIVAHAQSDAAYPSGLGCGAVPNTVSGEAFSAYTKGTFLGSTLAAAKVGDANLPPTGGSDSNNVLSVAVPGAVVAGAGTNTTSGSINPSPSSTSASVIANPNLLGGLITADLLDVTSSSSATTASNGTKTASTSFGSTCGTTTTCGTGCTSSAPCFVNLVVNGVSIVGSTGGTVTPNTTIAIPQPGGGLVLVILNEQTTGGDGMSSTTGTVNAIHAYVLNGSGVLTAEVIVASAHSDAEQP